MERKEHAEQRGKGDQEKERAESRERARSAQRLKKRVWGLDMYVYEYRAGTKEKRQTKGRVLGEAGERERERKKGKKRREARVGLVAAVNKKNKKRKGIGREGRPDEMRRKGRERRVVCACRCANENGERGGKEKRGNAAYTLWRQKTKKSFEEEAQK